jgi:hypothetical protein
MGFMMPLQEKTLRDILTEVLNFIKQNKVLLLSHHLKKDSSRCLVITGTLICARCFGFLIGLIVAILFLEVIRHNWIFLFTAFPGLIEWNFHRIKNISFPAPVISFFGFLMGLTYIDFLIHLISFEFSWDLIGIGFTYFLIFVLVVILTKK